MIDTKQLAAWRKLCEEAKGRAEISDEGIALLRAARTALPLLLDEVEALQRRVAELEAEVARLNRESTISTTADKPVVEPVDGYKLTYSIDATAAGGTQGARGMGSTVAEAVASLREQLGKLDLPRS